MTDRNVADELALRELVARYADAVCRRDAAAWGATWAADGEWQIMGQTAQGRDEIVALWERFMAGIPQVIQIPHEGLIEIDGARASLRWYVTEQGKLADGSALVMTGIYLDECVKEDEVWLFAKRVFHSLYSGPPDLSADFQPLPAELVKEFAGG
jgi:uncharacterized protein (TIGR02246 family)